MNVKELIEFLHTQPSDLPVAYEMCSEYKVLETSDIKKLKLQPARPDGWVHDDWNSKELATVEYLVLPGN